MNVMHIKLTLQEKLRDLRGNIKLEELSAKVGISVSTLSRFETNEQSNIAYQDLVKLARYHNVSMDYLSGLTNNKQYRNIAIDELALTDDAVAVLKSKKANNRLISELLAHEDFPKLLSAMEVYIDRKISAQTSNMNAVFKFAENTLKENFTIEDNDEVMAFLKEATIDEDDYLRYRIAERFNIIMKSLFDRHKKDALSDMENGIMEQMKDGLNTYLKGKAKNENYERIAFDMFAKNLGVDTSSLTHEEVKVMLKIIENSNLHKVIIATKRGGVRKKK